MSRRALVVLAIVLVGLGIAGVKAKAAATRRDKAQQVLDKYLAAVGGRQALEVIQTLEVTGVADCNGKAMKLRECHSAPQKYHGIMANDDEARIEATDGHVAWVMSDRQVNVLVGDSRAYAMREEALDRDLNWRKYYKSIEYQGKTPFAGRSCEKIAMYPREGKVQFRYYDPQTNYLVGEERPSPNRNGPAQISTYVYDNYRAFGGITVPTSIVNTMGAQRIAATIQQVMVNPSIADEVYDRPQAVKLQLIAMPGYLRAAAGDQ